MDGRRTWLNRVGKLLVIVASEHDLVLLPFIVFLLSQRNRVADLDEDGSKLVEDGCWDGETG